MWKTIVPLAALMMVGCGSAPKPGGYRVYVTNEASGDLTVIDSEKMEAVARIPLGKRPRGIHASPDGKTIYVALSGSPIAGPGVDESTLPPPDKSADGIGVFDVASQKLLRVIHSGSDPEEFDLSRDGKLIYVSNEDVGGASILDLATEKILKEFKTGEEPEGVTVSPDGKLVLVTSEDAGTVAVVDTARNELVDNIKVGRRPRSIAFLPDSNLAWVNAENDGTVVLLDVAKKAAAKTVTLGEAGVVKPMKVLLSPDSKTLFVSTGRGKKVFFLDAATGATLGEVEAGRRPWGLGLSPDGKTLFTANGPGNDIAVIDVATKSVVKRIASEGSPWGVLTLKQ
ncbi:MAG: beta-propeller fold lactonase family protein [Bryobacter sp.]|jgi:YVTN family beta-propeller protein|nr:beta-propeller fold lactonase family protein [Bryobacter sp. CoA8 C33]